MRVSNEKALFIAHSRNIMIVEIKEKINGFIKNKGNSK